MSPDDPPILECPNGVQRQHSWVRQPDGTAKCKYCPATLTKAQAVDCFYDTSRGRY